MKFKKEKWEMSTRDKNFAQRDLSGYYKYTGRVIKVCNPYDYLDSTHNEHGLVCFVTVHYRVKAADETETLLIEHTGVCQEKLENGILDGTFVKTTEEEFNETKRLCYEKYVEEWKEIKPNDLFYLYDGNKHKIYLVTETYKIENEKPGTGIEADKYRVVYKEKLYEDLEYRPIYYNAPYHFFRRYKKGMGVEDKS